MDLLANLALGFSVALTPTTLALAIAGCVLGTMIGALPGLGPSNGVAILIPLSFSFGLDATQALVLMTSVYYGAMYGGRISSILLNIPGDEPAMMTTLDGYPLAKQGRAGDALVLSGVASFVGALLATIGLMLLAPILARVAFLFGPAEYFALYLLAFCTLGGMGSNNQAKAAIAVCLGLGIAMIGVDSSTGMTRFTGGSLHLFDGVDFLVAIVGLFAVAEVFVFIESHGRDSAIGVTLEKIRIPVRDILATRITMLRATAIGFVAGLLPGAGFTPMEPMAPAPMAPMAPAPMEPMASVAPESGQEGGSPVGDSGFGGEGPGPGVEAGGEGPPDVGPEGQVETADAEGPPEGGGPEGEGDGPGGEPGGGDGDGNAEMEGADPAALTPH